MHDPRAVRWSYNVLVAQLLNMHYGIAVRWQWLLVYGAQRSALCPYFPSRTPHSSPLAGYVFLSRAPGLTRMDKRRPGQWFFTAYPAERLPPGLLMLCVATSWTSGVDQSSALLLGARFGIAGGAAAAVRDVAMPVVALTAHALRTRAFPGASGFTEVIHARFGTLAAVLFQLIIAYRLFTSVWANAQAVAYFYSPTLHCAEWWVAAALSVGLPMLAVLQCGARTALRADLLLGLVAAFGALAAAAWALASAPNNDPGAMLRSSSGWTVSGGGGDVIAVSFIEAVSSYGFFDPVLTDRAFMASPKATTIVFFLAALLGAMKVFAASIAGLGAAARSEFVATGIASPYFMAPDVAAPLGRIAYQVITLYVLSSTLSTLNATLTCAGKLWSLECRRLLLWHDKPLSPMRARIADIMSARVFMLFVAISCILPLLAARPFTLIATLASGTPVLGLGWPLFYAAARPKPPKRTWATPFVFIIPLGFSIAIGIARQVSATRPADVLTQPHMAPVAYGLMPLHMVVGTGPAKALLAWTLLTCYVALGGCIVAAIVEEVAARYSKGEEWEFRTGAEEDGEEARESEDDDDDASYYKVTADLERAAEKVSVHSRKPSQSQRNGQSNGEVEARRVTFPEEADDDDLAAHSPRPSTAGRMSESRFARVSEHLRTVTTRFAGLLAMAAPENAPEAPPSPRRSITAARSSYAGAGSRPGSRGVPPGAAPSKVKEEEEEEEEDMGPPPPAGPAPGCSWESN